MSSDSIYKISHIDAHVSLLGVKFPNQSTSASNTELKDYEELSTTFSATGGRVIAAQALVIRRIGKLVTVQFAAATPAAGVAAVVSGAAGAIPLRFAPSASTVFLVQVTDNGAKTTGVLTISATGAITLAVGLTEQPFTVTTNAGWSQFAVSYPVA